MTPNQLEKYIKAFERKEKHRIVIQDHLNYVLGKYVGYAFNDPKKYPKEPYLGKIEEEKKVLPPQSVSDMERMARFNNLRLGGIEK